MPATCSYHDLAQLSAEARAALLKRSETDLSGFIETVRPILEAVRLEGDEALARYGRDLDGADVSAATLKVTEAEVDAAFRAVDPKVIEAIRFAGRQHPLLP